MEPLQWVDLTRSRPLGNVCYLRIDVKRTLRIELRMWPFGGKLPSNTATLAAEWRPWSLFSEVARFLQTGRTIEDPYDRLLWSAVVRSRAYGRRQCSNTGHSLTQWRKGQIDPLLTFPVGPATAASRPIAVIRYEVLLDPRRRPPWCWRPLYAKSGGSFAASVTRSPHPSEGDPNSVAVVGRPQSGRLHSLSGTALQT